MDIVRPMEMVPRDSRHVITLTDYHSKWAEVAFTVTVTSENVIAFLTVFSRYGNPRSLVTDNGSQFTSS